MRRRVVTKATLRRGLVRLIQKADQIVRDVQWWNTNRTDSAPFDCEVERVLAATGRRALAALDAGDMAEHSRLVDELAGYAARECAATHAEGGG